MRQRCPATGLLKVVEHVERQTPIGEAFPDEQTLKEVFGGLDVGQCRQGFDEDARHRTPQPGGRQSCQRPDTIGITRCENAGNRSAKRMADQIDAAHTGGVECSEDGIGKGSS